MVNQIRKTFNKKNELIHKNPLDVPDCARCRAIRNRVNNDRGWGVHLKELTECAGFGKGEKNALRHIGPLKKFGFIKRIKPRKKRARYIKYGKFKRPKEGERVSAKTGQNLPPPVLNRLETINTLRGKRPAKGWESQGEMFDDLSLLLKVMRVYAWCHYPKRRPGPCIAHYGTVLCFGPLPDTNPDEGPLSKDIDEAQKIADKFKCIVIFVSKEKIPEKFFIK